MTTCPFCKGPIEQRRVEHVHRWDGELYILRNVPRRGLHPMRRSLLWAQRPEVHGMMSSRRTPSLKVIGRYPSSPCRAFSVTRPSPLLIALRAGHTPFSVTGNPPNAYAFTHLRVSLGVPNGGGGESTHAGTQRRAVRTSGKDIPDHGASLTCSTRKSASTFWSVSP